MSLGNDTDVGISIGESGLYMNRMTVMLSRKTTSLVSFSFSDPCKEVVIFLVIDAERGNAIGQAAARRVPKRAWCSYFSELIFVTSPRDSQPWRHGIVRYNAELMPIKDGLVEFGGAHVR